MKKVDQIIIGALLHDIGKFNQRAGINHRLLKDESEKIRLCKKNSTGDYYNYIHSLYTSAFFEDYKNFLPQAKEKFPLDQDNIPNFASCHHNPSTAIGWIINEADRLSNGMDRSPEGLEEESEIKPGQTILASKG